MKSFKIITFGCRVNQAESRLMAEQLAEKLKLKPLKTGRADLTLINSCCVTIKAEKEVRQAINRIKRDQPNSFLAVAGCLVDQINNPQLPVRKINRQALSQADLLLTNKQKKDLVEILASQGLHFQVESKKQFNYQDKYAQSQKALVKVQEGCDHFCAYCIIPYVRDRSQSRPKQDILQEVKELIDRGRREIILTGIDLASYDNDLVQLIKLVLTKTKIKKISFGSVNIAALDDRLVNLLADNRSRLTSHLHIPLQSGSNQTLERMGRGYTVEDFWKTIKKLKSQVSGFSFSTDLIVGFPGETSQEFNQTVKTIKKLKKVLGGAFKHAHVFRYARRPGTLAAKKETSAQKNNGWKKISAKEKKRRSERLRRLVSE